MPRRRVEVPPSTLVSPGSSAERDETELLDNERDAAGDIALLDDAAFSAYKWSIWRRRLSDEISREPDGGEWEHVATRIGPIDEEWARETLGGGTFKLRGYFDNGDGRGRMLTRQPVITIAGPRRNFAAVVVPTPVAPPAAAPPTDSITGPLLEYMRSRDRELDRVIDRLSNVQQHAPAPQPVPSLKDVVESLAMLDKMRGSNAPADPNDKVVSTMLEMVQKGIDLGREREPAAPAEGEPTNPWATLAVALAPLADKILTTIAMRERARAAPQRPRAPGAAPPPPATEPSSATVVGEPETEPVVEAPGLSARLMVAIEALARAVARGDDPVVFAATLDQVLDDQELGTMRLTDDAVLLSQIRAVAGTTWPVLATDAAERFLSATLAEIRNPSEPVTDEEPEA